MNVTALEELLQGCDIHKDQSYMLWRLQQNDLDLTLFPLGDYTKQAIVALARRENLVAEDFSESQDVCFIPDGDYRRFLAQEVADRLVSIGAGDLVDAEGRVLGRHPGFYHFTIGQRKGFGIGFGERRYVTAIDAAANRVTIGAEAELRCASLLLEDVNWVSSIPLPSFRGQIRLRYKHRGAEGVVTALTEDRVRIDFDEPQKAVTPGQSAVAYDRERLILGGIISQKSVN